MDPPRRHGAALFLLVAACLSASCSKPSRSATSSGRALSFDRVALVGASMSAGIGSGTPIPKVIEAALGERGKIVLNAVDVATYVDVVTIADEQITRAAAARPTVVLGLDILFWYVYGKTLTPEDRRARLELGLKSLEKLAGVPVFVGDFPDMTGAERWVLSPRAIPKPEELVEYNARVRAFAADKPWLHVLPLAAWTVPLRSNGSIDIAGRAVPARSLLSPDGLHPGEQGLRWVLAKVWDEMLAAYPGTAKDTLRIPPVE